MRQRSRGLSLLEMLVTLLVAGMALLLLTQAIGQYQRAQSSVLQFERAAREYRMSEAWWRASVEGLQAFEDAPFEGGAEGFSGITLSPVLAGQGTQAVQSWRAVFAENGGWGLALEENGRLIILPLDRAGAPRFRYLSEGGEWHPEWPPALAAQASLPVAIALHLDSEGHTDDERIVLAAVTGARQPVDLQFERGDL